MSQSTQRKAPAANERPAFKVKDLALAAQQVEKMGYGDVASLQGGIRRWKTEGRPVAAPQDLT